MRSAKRGLIPIVIASAIATVMYFRGTRPLAGTSERRLVVGSVTRTYLLHAGGAAKPGRPLVLVLHGLRGSGAGIERRTRATFDKLADRDGAVVAYPDALGDVSRWNDGWFEHVPGAVLPDDLAFIAALIDSAVAELGVDRKRVFAAGFSNGASMVYRLACQRPELVAGVAPVSGGMPPDLVKGCAQGVPVAVIGMHGTDDPMVPFDQSIRDGVAAWVERDGCPPRPRASRLPDVDPNDGTQTRVDRYGPCGVGTDVAFYTIEGGGHQWPGGDSPLTFVRHGDTPLDFDAGAVIWDFFERHPKR